MPFTLLSNEKLTPDTHRLRVSAPMAAASWQPGQFAVLRALETSERIPLSIHDVQPSEGTLAFVVKAIGFSTRELVSLPAGVELADVLAPLGQPSDLSGCERAAVVGGGVGAAVVYPVAKALSDKGVQVTAVLGARDRNQVILEEEFLRACEKVHFCTDDGSRGEKAFAPQVLENLLKSGQTFDRVYATGPVGMMQALADVTKPYNIRTIVSLNPIMVDGIGMCGGCRVLVGGEVRFACVDGPDFDAQQVDFESLRKRNLTYVEQETSQDHACRIETQPRVLR